MAKGTRRLLPRLRAATRLPPVTTAHLPKFPPPESIETRRAPAVPRPPFVAAEWAEAQLPPPSSLSAFAHRIGLASVLDKPELIQQACTHPSFATLYAHHHPNSSPLPTNSQLETIGNSLLGLFATEHISASFPYLPTRVLKAAVTAHVGPMTCASVAQEMGATPLLRWRRTPNTPTSPALLHPDALASIPRAITALVYQKQSLASAREFVQSFFLSRDVDLRAMIKFRDPKFALLEMVDKFDRARPKSRLLRETGRYSSTPVFVVGIFSGHDQLGEGFGSSLKMAEYRAAEDALHRVYLTRTPPQHLQVPSNTFSLNTGSVYSGAPEAAYVAPPLIVPEIQYASSGRSSG
ncbi:ribonuclease III [Cylindrobasidium torrendii FP15055 ss-10]|uniref:Large ribosomal subunit protein mL44 n=1 Tax=Cylindrobasidium torrendii FP15055 ss-10 TaxID=1314674 RepID=A0A0D7B3J8_9AGAR|nr:ribonuclease III [Cylindrobasidium torrendii FP15055 ss-10]